MLAILAARFNSFWKKYQRCPKVLDENMQYRDNVSEAPQSSPMKIEFTVNQKCVRYHYAKDEKSNRSASGTRERLIRDSLEHTCSQNNYEQNVDSNNEPVDIPRMLQGLQEQMKTLNEKIHEKDGHLEKRLQFLEDKEKKDA